VDNLSTPLDSSSTPPSTSSPLQSKFSHSVFFHVALVLVLGIWLFGLEGGWLGGLEMGGLGLTDRDEGSNAEAAREMLETGDWISPTLNYEPRFAKPAFVYWLISGSYSLFGINEFAARFPSAVSGLCVLFLQYAFVYRWFGAPLACLSSIMLLLNMEFLAINRMVLTDPELVVFTTLAGYSFLHASHGSTKTSSWWFICFYLAMGFGMLVKGPVGIIIPLVGVIPYLTLTRQWKKFWQKGFPLLGTGLVLLVAAPWYVAMFKIHGEAYWAAAQANTTGRFVSSMEGHGGTLFFYVPILLLGFFPWSAFLPSVLYQSLKQWKAYWNGQSFVTRETNLEFFLSMWVVGLLIFFTLSATRLPHYIYPLFPASAILVALWWKRFHAQSTFSDWRIPRRLLLGIGYVLGVAIIIAPAIFQQFMKQIAKEFPAAVHVDFGWLPTIMGLVIVLGTMGIRQCLDSETKRLWAVGIAGGMIVVFSLFGVKGALPVYHMYFIEPPQQLAAIAGYNLKKDDRLLQVGRKRPSLSFYAKRKVNFLGPHDEKEWEIHLAASGKKMIILQTPLRRDIPEAVSDWTVVLEHGGFSLLSSEPLL
jgi:4-amino-4-deoxy-L-arabinose transferase-like glycosyltransferase